ncbi:MAG TPA: hypothetical protein VFE98_06500 [Candidatus Bathyarchaeia archaeon]|nr:hypothetical protein [Candidatus Bathyarchaeia archaeon]
MKKCAVCGSFSPDEESTCGICARSLRDVEPIHESLESVELADQAARRAEDREEATIQLRRVLVRTLAGLGVGAGVLVFGIVALFFNGFGVPLLVYLSFLLFPLGLWILASSLGGLVPGSLQAYIRARWYFLLHAAPQDDALKREKRDTQPNN